MLVGQVLNDGNNVYNLTTLAKIAGAEIGDILVVRTATSCRHVPQWLHSGLPLPQQQARG